MTNITTNHAITYTNLFTYEAFKILKNSLKRVRAFQIELEIGRVGLEERRKPGYQEKNISEHRREPTANSTHIWC